MKKRVLLARCRMWRSGRQSSFARSARAHATCDSSWPPGRPTPRCASSKTSSFDKSVSTATACRSSRTPCNTSHMMIVVSPRRCTSTLDVEPVRLGIVQAIEVVNPHSAVDDDHGQVTSGGVRAVTNGGRPARAPSLSSDEGWPGRGSESATAAPPQPPRASSSRRCSASPAACGRHEESHGVNGRAGRSGRRPAL